MQLLASLGYVRQLTDGISALQIQKAEVSQYHYPIKKSSFVETSEEALSGVLKTGIWTGILKQDINLHKLLRLFSVENTPLLVIIDINQEAYADDGICSCLSG